MNIFREEMRRGLKSLITWTLSLIIITFLFMMIYPSMSPQMAEFTKVIESFPVEFRQAFGMTNLTDGGFIGFYSFIFIFVLLAGAIQATNLGVSSLSMEVRDKTADFLYAKPVSRCRIVTAKIASVLAQILIVSVVFILSAWFILAAANRASSTESKLDVTLFFLMTCTLFLLQLIFAGIGLMISAFLRRIRTVLPVSMGVVFFFYTLFILNQTLDSAELGLISPFSYFDLNKIMENKAYDPKYLIVASVLFVICIAATYRIYMKKDLPSI